NPAARPLLAEQGGDLSGVLPASCATRLELSHREQDREPGSRALFGAAGALSRGRRCDPDAIRTRPGRDPATTRISAAAELEAAPGFEPGINGFAIRRLNTWLCRRGTSQR